MITPTLSKTPFLFATFLTLLLPLSPLAAQGTAPTPSSDHLYEAINDEIVYQNGPVEAKLNGNVAVAPVGLRFCSDLVDPSCTQPFSVSIAPSVSTTLELSANGAASFTKEVFDVVSPLASFTAGGFTITPFLYFNVQVDGSVGAASTVSLVAHYSFPMEMTVGGSGVQASALTPGKVFHVDTPSLTQSSGASLEVTVTGALYFDIITSAGVPIGGPLLALHAGSELGVHPTANPWWALDAEFTITTSWFDYGAGLLPAIPVYNVSETLADAGGPLANLNELGALRWARTLGDASEAVTGAALTLSSNGTLLVSGDGAGVNTRLFYGELDGDGSLLFEDRFDLGSQMVPLTMDATSDGGSYVGGTALTSSGATVARFDANGALSWLQRVDTGVDRIRSVVTLQDGGVCAVGYSEASGDNHLWACKLDASGNLLWSKIYQAPDNRSSDGYQVRELANGQLAIAGRVYYEDDPNWTASTMRGWNAALVTLNADGSLDSTRLVGTRYSGSARCLCETPDGGFLLAGTLDNQDEHAWVAKLDAQGDLEWSRTLAGEAVATGITNPGNSPYDELNDVEPVDGGYVLSGVTGLGDSRDAWLLMIDEQGSIAWFKSFRGGHKDLLVDIEVIPGEGIAAIGTTSSFTHAEGSARDEMLLLRAGFDGMLHFQEQNGQVVFDVENDSISQGPTTDVVTTQVTLVAADQTATLSSPTIATSDPDLTILLRSF